MASDPVRWYRHEGDGFVIDVKVERMPGRRWSWTVILAVATALMRIAHEITVKYLEDAQPEPEETQVQGAAPKDEP